MFTRKIDDELQLAIPQKGFEKKYFEIIDSQGDYLSKWLPWVANYSQEDADSFVSRSLHGYADGKSLTCRIIYHGEIVGNVSFNTIIHHLKKVEIGY